MRWELKHQHPKKRKISQTVWDISYAVLCCYGYQLISTDLFEAKERKDDCFPILYPPSKHLQKKEISLKFLKLQNTSKLRLHGKLGSKGKTELSSLYFFFLIPNLHFIKVLFLLLLLLEKTGCWLVNNYWADGLSREKRFWFERVAGERWGERKHEYIKYNNSK